MAKKEYIYATGKRKSSIARVNIVPGTGKITINKKDMNEIYTLDTLKAIVLKPFKVANTMEKYDVEATVCGGGFAGQAGAVAHGIAKALATTDPEVRLILKRNGLLTRDSRVKERRKYGLKKARKAPQFSKR
ncbi:30S ribosomal protein S9 [Clostridium sp. CAG:921]|nr:30S ribosomal protein S9 [Clostridium sp. CAG:921]